VFDLGVFVDRVGVQVWTGAIAVTRLDDAGNFRDRYIFLIEQDTFARIQQGIRELGLSYVANADAIRMIEATVPSFPGDRHIVGDWDPFATDGANTVADGSEQEAAQP
jgi:hypothetical protein